jgi:hypothetical protein
MSPSATAFLLQVIEAPKDDTFPMAEIVSNVGKIVARITGRHMKVSPVESTLNSMLSVAVIGGEVLLPSFSLLLPSLVQCTVG